MTTEHPIGRRAFLGGLALGSMVLLSGCSIKRVADDAGPVDAAAFPVTITHAYGATTINAPAARVVTIGKGSGETCLAFGLSPVGMGLGPDGLSSWFTDEQNETEVLEPALFSDSEIGKVLEVISDLTPDVILALNSSITRADFDELQKIAPTVAFPDHPGNTEWRTMTDTIGQVLGRSAQTPQIIAEVEEAIADAHNGLSDFDGVTALYFSASSTAGAGFTVWGSDTNPMRLLREFGVSDSPALQMVTTEAEPLLDWGSPVYQQYVWPAQRAGDLQADVPVVSMKTDEEELIERNDVLGGIPGAAEKRIVRALRTKDATALEEASPLSIKWVAKNLIPEIARAQYLSSQG